METSNMGGSKLRCPSRASKIIGLSGAGSGTNADGRVMNGNADRVRRFLVTALEAAPGALLLHAGFGAIMS